MNDEREKRLAIARALLDQHGLHNWQIDFADLSRVKSRSLTGASYGPNGICDFWNRRIVIDPRLIPHRNRFLATLRHEIAHSLLGRPGHDAAWRRIAKRVGCSKRSLSVYKNLEK